jgi:hypothetical protein
VVYVGQKQCVHLDLGGRKGDFFDNISFLRIVVYGREALHTVVVGNGLPQGKAVKHGGDITGF